MSTSLRIVPTLLETDWNNDSFSLSRVSTVGEIRGMSMDNFANSQKHEDIKLP